MKRTILALGVALSLASCGPSEAEKLAQLEARVIEVHDAVMPQMGTTSALSDTLRQLYSYYSSDSMYVDTVLLEELQMHLTTLTNADEGMMQWMREYQPPHDSLAPAVVRTYLEKEQVRINAVRDSMLSAIAATEAFLAQVKNSDHVEIE